MFRNHWSSDHITNCSRRGRRNLGTRSWTLRPHPCRAENVESQRTPESTSARTGTRWSAAVPCSRNSWILWNKAKKQNFTVSWCFSSNRLVALSLYTGTSTNLHRIGSIHCAKHPFLGFCSTFPILFGFWLHVHGLLKRLSFTKADEEIYRRASEVLCSCASRQGVVYASGQRYLLDSVWLRLWHPSRTRCITTQLRAQLLPDNPRIITSSMQQPVLSCPRGGGGRVVVTRNPFPKNQHSNACKVGDKTKEKERSRNQQSRRERQQRQWLRWGGESD